MQYEEFVLRQLKRNGENLQCLYEGVPGLLIVFVLALIGIRSEVWG